MPIKTKITILKQPCPVCNVSRLQLLQHIKACHVHSPVILYEHESRAFYKRHSFIRVSGLQYSCDAEKCSSRLILHKANGTVEAVKISPHNGICRQARWNNWMMKISDPVIITNRLVQYENSEFKAVQAIRYIHHTVFPYENDTFRILKLTRNGSGKVSWVAAPPKEAVSPTFVQITNNLLYGCSKCNFSATKVDAMAHYNEMHGGAGARPRIGVPRKKCNSEHCAKSFIKVGHLDLLKSINVPFEDHNSYNIPHECINWATIKGCRFTNLKDKKERQLPRTELFKIAVAHAAKLAYNITDFQIIQLKSNEQFASSFLELKRKMGGLYGSIGTEMNTLPHLTHDMFIVTDTPPYQYGFLYFRSMNISQRIYICFGCDRFIYWGTHCDKCHEESVHVKFLIVDRPNKVVYAVAMIKLKKDDHLLNKEELNKLMLYKLTHNRTYRDMLQHYNVTSCNPELVYYRIYKKFTDQDRCAFEAEQVALYWQTQQRSLFFPAAPVNLLSPTLVINSEFAKYTRRILEECGNRIVWLTLEDAVKLNPFYKQLSEEIKELMSGEDDHNVPHLYIFRSANNRFYVGISYKEKYHFGSRSHIDGYTGMEEEEMKTGKILNLHRRLMIHDTNQKGDELENLSILVGYIYCGYDEESKITNKELDTSKIPFKFITDPRLLTASYVVTGHFIQTFCGNDFKNVDTYSRFSQVISGLEDYPLPSVTVPVPNNIHEKNDPFLRVLISAFGKNCVEWITEGVLFNMSSKTEFAEIYNSMNDCRQSATKIIRSAVSRDVIRHYWHDMYIITQNDKKTPTNHQHDIVLYENEERAYLDGHSYKLRNKQFQCSNSNHCEATLQVDGDTKLLTKNGVHSHDPQQGWRTITMSTDKIEKLEDEIYQLPIENKFFLVSLNLSVLEMDNGRQIITYSHMENRLRAILTDDGTTWQISANWPTINLTAWIRCSICDDAFVRSTDELDHYHTEHSLEKMLRRNAEALGVIIRDDLTTLQHMKKLSCGLTEYNHYANEMFHFQIDKPPQRVLQARTQKIKRKLVYRDYHRLVLWLTERDVRNTLDPDFTIDGLNENQLLLKHFQNFSHRHFFSNLPSVKHVLQMSMRNGHAQYHYLTTSGKIRFICTRCLKTAADSKSLCDGHLKSYRISGFAYYKQKFAAVYMCARVPKKADYKVRRALFTKLGADTPTDVTVIHLKVYDDTVPVVTSKIEHYAAVWATYIACQAWNAETTDGRIEYKDFTVLFYPKAFVEALYMLDKMNFKIMLPKANEVPFSKSLSRLNNNLSTCPIKKYAKSVYMYRMPKKARYVGATHCFNATTHINRTGPLDLTNKGKAELRLGQKFSELRVIEVTDGSELEMEFYCQLIVAIKTAVDVVNDVTELEPLSNIQKTYPLPSNLFGDRGLRLLSEASYYQYGRVFLYRFEVKKTKENFLANLKIMLSQHTFQQSSYPRHPISDYHDEADVTDSDDEESNDL